MTLQTKTPRRCKRCSTNDGVLKLRIEHVCSDCYCRFIATKTVKRLELLNRDIRGAAPQHRPKEASASEWLANNSKTFLVGLSFGPSSASLVSVCEQIVAGQLAKGRDAAFTLHVVHVDTDLDNGDGDGDRDESKKESGNDARTERSRVTQLLDHWRQRFPRFTFERVPLADVLQLQAIDWSLLLPSEPATNSGHPVTASSSPPPSPASRLRAMFARLPSASSRQDILEMLVRRLLIARAAAGNHKALLLGCSTTALAERTLAETAKGRGYSLPWQIHDGPAAEAALGPEDEHSNGSPRGSSANMLLYYPMRELFRKELVTYAGLAQPALADLIFPPLSPPISPPLSSLVDSGQRTANTATATTTTAAAVISHKNLSIEEVMARYFAEVEENYPSIVANVVKTATKLERRDDFGEDRSTWTRADHSCGTCGMPLDDFGNERWKGEIGELDSKDSSDSQRPPGARGLCYGCERSIMS